MLQRILSLCPWLGLLWDWLGPRGRRILGVSALALAVTLFLGQMTSQAIGTWLARRTADWPYWAIDWLINAILLSAVLAVIFRVKGKSATSSAPKTSAMSRLIDDMALHGDQPDELGLDKFVERLARTVVLPANANSLVIGLEAAWGSGKSSALELLCRRLGLHPDKPVVVRFNPWMASGNDGVSRAFFSQLSGSFRSADEQRVAKKLVTYAEMLEELTPPPARMLPRVGIQHLRRIAGRIPEVDIQDEWEQLSKSVLAINRPVVVIIDDIDRLEPEDVVTIFQIVKAVASFPRITYVLAFDPKPVDAALEKSGMYVMGREYGDKIVQANIVLPRIPYTARKRFLQKKLEQRIDAWQFNLLDTERHLLDKAIPLVLTALKTPRDIKRVLNKTLMAAESLRDEVNFADVLVFEATHAMFPDVITLIRQRPEVVNAGDHEIDDDEANIATLVAENLKDRGKDARLGEFTRLYSGREAELGPLLMFLFGPFFDKDAEAPPAGDLRVSDPSTLRKLLYQEITGELSAAIAMQFLNDPDSRAPQLAEAVETNALPGLLARVKPYTVSISPPKPLQLLQQVAEATNQQFLRWGSDSTHDAAWFAIAVLDAVKENEVRWKVLEDFIGNRDFVGTTESVLAPLLRDVGLWKDGTYLGVANLDQNARGDFPWLNAQRLDGLRRIWIDIARAHGARDILTRFPNAGGVFIRWRQLSQDSPSEVQQLLEVAFEDPQIGARFINLWPPGISLQGVKKLLTPGSIKLLQSALSHSSVDRRIAERVGSYLARETDTDDFGF
jgi:hypothetical protein